ncbi:MAG: hypothetical protein H0V86_01790 [Chloroflexia bacterium]|nr:hypothetical protein [Chloroflexia bacterium]
MSTLNVELAEGQLRDLERFAAARKLPVSGIVRDYVEYLLAGGQPVGPPADDEHNSRQLAVIAQRGGSFAWLDDEPDLYSSEDGEPV